MKLLFWALSTLALIALIWFLLDEYPITVAVTAFLGAMIWGGIKLTRFLNEKHPIRNIRRAR